MSIARVSARLLAGAALAVAAMTCVGCEAFGIAAAALVPPKTDAVYEIKDVPTVIIVDDPNTTLRDPQLVLVIGESCADVLKSNDIITKVIDMKQVTALATELGDKYS